MSSLTFLLDQNLGLPTDKKPWSDILSDMGIKAINSTDLVKIDEMVAKHEPDIAFIPSGDYHRLFAKGDRHYQGLAISSSKFTGETTLKSLLIVRKDDPADCLSDLQGEKYGYINKSCSSTYFPPAILLQRKGKKLEDFLKITPVKPGPTWEGLADAVVEGKVRATMILEDVWKTFPKNADTTKVIAEYTGSKGSVILVREDLDRGIREKLLSALLAWAPEWKAVYGGFKPYYYADVHHWFHDLDQLPAGV